MSTELTADIVKQLNNLASFPPRDTYKLGDCQRVSNATPLVLQKDSFIEFTRIA